MFWVGLSSITVALAGLAMAWAQSAAPPSLLPQPQGAAPLAGASAAPLDPARRQAEPQFREGAELVDQLGHFKLAGDRVVFVLSEGRRSLVGLENLNLERIMRTVSGNPEPLLWNVSGTVTEYRGNNYLLIQRAILRTRTKMSDIQAPAPSNGGRK